MSEILNSKNKKRGFWAAAKKILQSDEQTQKAWEVAFSLLYEIADLKDAEIRCLLDSRWGQFIVQEFKKELGHSVFEKSFKQKLTKDDILRQYHYYVDAMDYGYKYPQKYKDFCAELTRLSLKYEIVLEVIGGVIFSTKGFQGYIPHLEQGDLLPRWKIK